jgi:hypothetical protein
LEKLRIAVALNHRDMNEKLAHLKEGRKEEERNCRNS